MTAIIAAMLAPLAGAPSTSASLHDQSISISSFATAVASYQIGSDGKARDGAGNVLESWLLGGGPASNYEVQATYSSGAVPSGTLATWLNCGSSRTWFVSNGARNNSVISSAISVQIRDVATQTVQASASITLSAESDNFG